MESMRSSWVARRRGCARFRATAVRGQTCIVLTHRPAAPPGEEFFGVTEALVDVLEAGGARRARGRRRRDPTIFAARSSMTSRCRSFPSPPGRHPALGAGAQSKAGRRGAIVADRAHPASLPPGLAVDLFSTPAPVWRLTVEATPRFGSRALACWQDPRTSEGRQGRGTPISREISRGAESRYGQRASFRRGRHCPKPKSNVHNRPFLPTIHHIHRTISCGGGRCIMSRSIEQLVDQGPGMPRRDRRPASWPPAPSSEPHDYRPVICMSRECGPSART
jgi:hypothetical protein